MISVEKLDGILSLLIEKDEIKDSDLVSLEFSSSQVEAMLEEGTLCQIQPGYYNLSDGSFFYEKALALNRGKKFKDAAAYFKKSYELGYEGPNCLFHLFLYSISTQDYEKALSYLEPLYQDKSKQNAVARCYNEMFFVLLANLVDSPLKEKEVLQKSYFSLGREDNDSLAAKEAVRKAVLARQFDTAYHSLNSSFIYGPYRMDAQVMAMKQLLLANQKRERIEEKQLTYYYQNGDYASIVTSLSQKEDKCGLLSLEQSLMLKIAQKHVLLEGEQPLPKSPTEKTDLFSLVETNHFDKVSEYVEKELRDVVLLEDILRDTVTLQKKVNLSAPHTKISPVKLKEEDKEENTSLNAILLLQQGEYQKGIKVISSLLQEKGKEKCQDIVMDSLRYSLLEEDSDFEEVTKTFSILMQEDKPTSLLPCYLVSFYQELGVDQAKSFLRLKQLETLDQLGYSCDAIPIMKKAFYFGGKLDSEAALRLEEVEKKLKQDLFEEKGKELVKQYK